MNKILFYIVLSVVFFSCDGMLDEIPKDSISRTNYYQNEADAQGAINGAYNSVGNDFYDIQHYLMVTLHGDYVSGRGSQGPISIMNQVLDQQNIGRVSSSWSRLYSAINRANAVLDNVPGIEDMTEEVRIRILAEAHFLRAMAYFELVRGWGEVPLKTKESTDLSQLEAPRMPESDVYELIVSDLTVAEKDLPETVGEETGRASKWAAKMLLAHVYVTTKNWTAAAEKANDVIAGGRYSLVSVQQADDFYKIFAANTSTEDIMSVHHSETRQSVITDYEHLGSAYPYNYSSTGYYAWLPNMNSFIGSSWDDNDLRKSFNLYTKYQNAKGEWKTLPNTIGVLFKKFITGTDGLKTYNVPIYRYAEAFLFYAEAACEAEGAPSALALDRLNHIRRRAYGYDPEAVSPADYPSGMSKEAFIEAVMQERAYEFLLERRRWFDLKRTGKAKEAFVAIGKNLIDARMLWPIPENEINNNPGIDPGDQNPGY